MTIVRITIYFDTTCAWCIIGQRVLDQAIDIFQKTYPGARQDAFEFDLRPFYLRPDAPMQGAPLLTAMVEKNGVEMTERIKMRVSRIAKGHGIEMSYGSKTGNTRKSHRLIWGAGRECTGEVQRRLLAQILSMHFERDGDITNEDDLAKEAQTLGIPLHVATEWMKDEQVGSLVDEAAAQARKDGIKSVPTYLVNGVEVEGAADVTAFYDAFVRARIGAV